jgi:hypothetical protein
MSNGNNQEWNVNDDAQMPLGVGGGDETPIGGEEKKGLRIQKSWILLAVAFAAGIGLVYVMGKQGGPQPVNAEQQSKDAQFQASLQELAGKAGKKDASSMDTDALVKLFKGGPVARTHEAIAGNPFELPQTKTVETPKEDPVITKVVEDPAEAQRLLKVGEALKKLKVTTIMFAQERSAALIGKDFVQVGSKVGIFKVVEITKDTVILEADGEKYSLKLQRPGAMN